MKSIAALAPDMIVKAEKFVAALLDAKIPFYVTSTLRTVEEQEALHAQGRRSLVLVNALRAHAKMQPLSEADNAYTVTNCDGIERRSAHQSGYAMDVVPAEHGNPVWPPADDPRWEDIGRIGESVGLIWGGRWESLPDPPHYELRSG